MTDTYESNLDINRGGNSANLNITVSTSALDVILPMANRKIEQITVLVSELLGLDADVTVKVNGIKPEAGYMTQPDDRVEYVGESGDKGC